MRTRGILAAAFLIAMAGVSMAEPPLQEHGAESLAAFGALVVGTWEADDSRHELEWGVGNRVIRSRSYFNSGGDWVLVSEGMWFWDPAERTVRGVIVAIEMPVEVFEYRSEVRGDEIVHDLVAHGAAGGRYIERWEFDDDGYRWSLERPGGDSVERVMGGAYRRGDASR